MAHPEVHELIVSGGDPWVLSDEKLKALITWVESIGHIRTLRFHTRCPIVLPERITDALIEMLGSTRLQVVVVVHTNHPQALDDQVWAACQRLKSVVTLLNQSVLLKGINDDASVLTELSHRLFACGILPYYLHQLDPVEGGAHFACDEASSKQIYQTLQANLPGYLVPKWVVEMPGADSKRPVR